MGELDHWLLLAEIAHEMAAKAASQDWDELVANHIRFQNALSALQSDAWRPIPETDRTEKAKLIRRILADYKQVRDRIGPWMADVRPLLEGWAHADRAA